MSIRTLLIVPAIALLAVLQVPPPGSALKSGMQLVYASQGAESAPWRVDSVNLSARFGGRDNCSVVRFAPRDIRRGCVAGDTLFAWRDSAQILVPSRPVQTGMKMRMAGSNGGTVFYETFGAEVVTISDLRIPVIATTVTTYNAAGIVVRRLRERYALSLATAVDGIFEVPTANGEWKVEQEFKLVRITGADSRQ